MIRRGRWKVLAAAALVAGMIVPPSGALGQTPSATRSHALAGHDGRTHGPLSPEMRAQVQARLARNTGRITAYVELAKAAAVDASDAASPSGTSASRQAAAKARNDTDTSANGVVADLKKKDSSAHEVTRTRNALAGVIVSGSVAAIQSLASRSDVANITALKPSKLDNAHAAVLTNVLSAWQNTGKFGDGVRVGIIDTGVDYTHANFAGPGTPAAFDAIDPTVAAGVFPTAKVVGGTDLAGEDYDADDPAHDTPAPDNNPLDCDGHGSHVAGTAAGFGENANGSTFTGNYSTLTPTDLYNMRIGPGMAPKALIYAIKAFGCPTGEAGSTFLVPAALDWALDPNGDNDFSDHLDVVNVSIGSDYSAPDDPENVIARKVMKKGVMAVFSAGNGGDFYDIGSDAPEVLSVASSRDSYELLDGAQVTAPSGIAGKKPGQYSFAFDYEGFDLTKPVVKMTQAGNKDGCDEFNATDTANVAGKYVWLEWDDNDITRRCGSAGRSDNATAAGAAGVLLSSSLEHFTGGILGNDQIPVFMFTGPSTTQVRPALNAGTLVVRLAGDLLQEFDFVDPDIEDTPSAFTSRGTRAPGVKPDIAAPGDTIVSTKFATGNGSDWLSGTSMASPHAAGITALLRQTHPTWTTAEIKAAAMNTANHDVYSGEGQTGPIEAPNRVGAGRIDALAALGTNVIAFDDDNPAIVSVGFGPVEVENSTMSLTRRIRVLNKGGTPVTYNLSYQAITAMPGVTYSLNKTSITVPANGSALVGITLNMTRDAMRKTHDPTIVENQEVVPGLFLPRQFLADASGRVRLDPTAGTSVPLRVPVYAAPKPVAAITTPSQLQLTNNTGFLELSGRGLNQGAGNRQYLSVYSVMELTATSPQLQKCAAGQTSGCAINNTAKGGDLKFVGVASSAPQAIADGAPEDSMMGFGIATYANWANIGVNTVPFVDIDVDGGAPDYETFVYRVSASDILEAWTVELTSGDYNVVDIEPVNMAYGDFDTNTFDTNVIVMPVWLQALGIDASTDTTARFRYFVGVDSYYAAPDDALVDFIPSLLTYDPLRPGLWAEGDGASIMYIAEPGTGVQINRRTASTNLDHSDSVLVLNLHNPTATRATVVNVKNTQAPAPPAPTRGARAT